MDDLEGAQSKLASAIQEAKKEFDQSSQDAFMQSMLQERKSTRALLAVRHVHLLAHRQAMHEERLRCSGSDRFESYRTCHPSILLREAGPVEPLPDLDEMEDKALTGDEAASHLLKRLREVGWKQRAGQLTAWEYYRPGALELTDHKKDFHFFESVDALREFVRSHRVDGIQRTGHISERKPRISPVTTVAEPLEPNPPAPPLVVFPSTGWGSAPMRAFGLIPNTAGDEVNVMQELGHAEEICVRLMRKGNSAQEKIRVAPMQISSSHTHIPIATAWTTLPKNYRVQDSKELVYTPYFGDNDCSHAEMLAEVYDTQARQKILDYGPEAVASFNETRFHQFCALAVNQVLKVAGDDRKDASQFASEHSTLISSLISRVGSESFDRPDDGTGSVQSLITELIAGQSTHKAAPVAEPTVTATPEEMESVAKDPDTQYLQSMDSFRHLLCRFCFQYDCNLHKGFGGGVAPASLEDQTHKALTWAADLDARSASILSQGKAKKWKGSEEELNTLLSRAWTIYQGSASDIARAFGLKEKVVITRLLANGIDPSKALPPPPPPESASNKKSQSRNFGRPLKKTTVAPTACTSFAPCRHSGRCTSTCECAASSHWCTKHCGCAAPPGFLPSDMRRRGLHLCAHYFGGCQCKLGQCNTKACPCFASGRECDPDTCGDCGACSASGLHPLEGQNCQNDNLAMGRARRLMIARSSIPEAGWGVFTRDPIAKNTFVGEYIGEMISQDEAERRGRVYDKFNRSYLFNLNADFCLDAARKGNKLRFANHSETPNIQPKVMFVNGEHRIGMYAIEDIPAQAELFFDYGYETEIKSPHLHKRAVTAEWMSNTKMANRVSKSMGLVVHSSSSNGPSNIAARKLAKRPRVDEPGSRKRGKN